MRVFKLSIIFLLFFFLVAPVSAAVNSEVDVSATGTDAYVSVQQRIRTNDSLRSKIRTHVDTASDRTTKREELKARLDENKQARISAHFRKLIARLNAAVTRLEKLISRIDARLAELGDTQDVSALVTDLASAESLLTDTKVLITDVGASLDALLESESPRDEFATIKSSVSAIKDNLKQVHSMLVEIITQIKGLRNPTQ